MAATEGWSLCQRLQRLAENLDDPDGAFERFDRLWGQALNREAPSRDWQVAALSLPLTGHVADIRRDLRDFVRWLQAVYCR